MTIEEIARRYVAGLNGQGGSDFVDLFAPKVVWWHSDDDPERGLIELHGARIADGRSSDDAGFADLMTDFKKEEKIFIGENGFALEQVISGTLADGTPMLAPHCEVVTVDDGRITRVSIYIDRQHHQPVVEARRGQAR